MKLLRSALILGVAAVALTGCGVFGGGSKKPKTAIIGERVAILSSESGVEADPTLAGVSILLPDAVTNTEWAQPGGNASKTMEHVALPATLTPAWSSKIAGTTKTVRLAASPIVAEGKIFVVDAFAQLTAFNASTGAKVWSAQVGAGTDSANGLKRDRASLFGGGVSYDSGRLYATNGLGDVAAFEAADGKQLWKVRPGGPLRGSPTIAIGNAIVMSQDNQIFALNLSDGSVAWTESASLELSGVFGVGAPAVAQGTVVAGFSSGELNAYRYENGRSLWSDALSRTSISTSVSSLSDVDASPVVDRGRVFAIGKGGRMISMDLLTGQRLWEINVAGISTPWVVGEWLFVVDDGGRLLCIARATGKVRWLTQLPNYKNVKKKKAPISWTGPILAGNRLVLASSLGQMVSVSPSDGTIQSQTKLGGAALLPPIVANNMLYILTNEGRLTAWR